MSGIYIYKDKVAEKIRKMPLLKYHVVSMPSENVNVINIDQVVNTGQVKRELARHIGVQWYLMDIVSLDQGSFYEDDDFIDTRQTLDVLKHPEERIVPFEMMTTLPDITDPDIDEPRVQLSCGHAMTPDNLYMNVTVKLKDGHDEIRCFQCNSLWDFNEITKKSIMTTDEKIFWGVRITLNKIRKDEALTECPKCRSYCERIEKSNDGARCIMCSKNGTIFDFCWKCKQPWNSGHKCGKEGLQQVLNTCGRKVMGYSNIPNVPTHRLCPNCGALIEHIEACKQTQCYRCKESFCFVCLTMCKKNALQCTSYSQQCTVAPVQTA